MTLTLVESAKLALNQGLVQKAAIIETYARESDLLRALPFTNIAGSAYAYNQEGVLPGIAFRRVNGTYTASEGVINPLTEVLKIAGGELKVDQALVKMHGPSVRAQHEAMKVKALARQISYDLIEGTTVTDGPQAAAIDGLKVRVPTGGAQGLDCGDGSDYLKLSKLDELIDLVDNPTHLLMNKAMRRNIGQYLRGSGTAVQRLSLHSERLPGSSRARARKQYERPHDWLCQ